MSIEETFTQLRARGEKALIPFITCGDPDLETSRQALFTLADYGADIIEVGVPYADPLADGPVIQAAATRALRRGTTPTQVLDLLAGVTAKIQTPLVLFSYYNPVLAVGPDAFIKAVAVAGVRGLVIPDLPLEESQEILALGAAHGVEVILLVAPTSPVERVTRIVEQSQGFVYLVSLTGTTGVRAVLSTLLPQRIALVRSLTAKPVAVGFGIATATQARQVADWGADGVIVGSACVRLLAETPAAERLEALAKFCQTLKEALRGSP
ncbi:tryptophan synthase subunit alpha [Anthocerotibacter panamensis]|uniref:tryptophan synthase subunit alpha n=1 Tax=Anthocerotibacter panamensis TaxID=2857077 RepID=UPI001FD9BE15|nr:tryptophan synthase subunit alpha [Anthocerotibacter panamensis]